MLTNVQAFKVYYIYSHWGKMCNDRPILLGWRFDFNSSVLPTYYVIFALLNRWRLMTWLYIYRFFDPNTLCFVEKPRENLLLLFLFHKRQCISCHVHDILIQFDESKRKVLTTLLLTHFLHHDWKSDAKESLFIVFFV